MKLSIAACLSLAVGTWLGWSARSLVTQDANELLDAGFVIVDPQGCEVERFDGPPAWSDLWCQKRLGGNGDPTPAIETPAPKPPLSKKPTQ